MRFLPLSLVALGARVLATTITEAINSQNTSLSTLSSLLNLDLPFVNELEALPSITILAPSNDALQNFLRSDAGTTLIEGGLSSIGGLLEYHCLNGTYREAAFGNSTVFLPTIVNESSFANVTGGQRLEGVLENGNITFISGQQTKSVAFSGPVNFTNGVLYVIDTVLTLPVSLSDTLSSTKYNLSTLHTLLSSTTDTSTNDAETLSLSLASSSDITIFAPSNAAFTAIDSALSSFSSAQLSDILAYHIVPNSVLYSSLLHNSSSSITTLDGKNLSITKEADGSLFVNAAKITTADLLLENGVLHIVDGVLNPNGTLKTPDLTTKTQMPAFSGAHATTTSTAASVLASSTSSSMAGAMPTGSVGMGMLFGAGGVGLLLV